MKMTQMYLHNFIHVQFKLGNKINEVDILRFMGNWNKNVEGPLKSRM